MAGTNQQARNAGQEDSESDAAPSVRTGDGLRGRGVPCSQCRLSPSCLSAHISLPDHEELRGLVRPLPPVERKQRVFEGSAPRDMFVLRSGSLQTSIQEANGNEQVLGFHLPGDIAGFGTGIEEFPGGRIVALERSSVCAINLDQIQAAATRVKGLQGQLYKLLEEVSTLAQQHIVNLGRSHAETRVALFLHDWSRRLQQAGRDGRQMDLPMRRSDIASFLGLATETTSRAFSRLEAKGVISMPSRRQTDILDPQRLAALTEDAGHHD